MNEKLIRRLLCITIAVALICTGAIFGLLSVLLTGFSLAAGYNDPHPQVAPTPAYKEIYEAFAEMEIVLAEVKEVSPLVKSTPVYFETIDTTPSAPLSDDVPLPWDLQQAIVDNCIYFGLDPHIVLGIIETESTFRTEADNGICYGLMQIHRGNQNWVLKNAGVTNIFDPAQNIRAGCWILWKGLQITGNLEEALVWYNAGEVYASSTPYSCKVLKSAEKWAEIMEGE